MNTYDFIAIGDTVTDEFIELEDVRIDTKRDPEDKGYDEICFRFGDKVSYKNLTVIHAVGNSANAAVAATRLGLKTAFVSDVGDDELGTKILETLTGHNVSTSFIRIHEDMLSNHHYVLQYGPERTILIKHQPYPYALPDIGEPTWLYLSSLANHSLEYHHEIARYLEAHPSIKLAFQPGTFQIQLGAKELSDVYAHTHTFFCNREEAGRILETSDISDIKILLEGISKLGPKIVIITDGPKGAYAYDAHNNETFSVTMYPDPKPPVDRTGAGDAFSSTVIAALALGKPLSEALAWGPINSMSVVQYIGAQKGLLSREQLEKHLVEAPANYQVKKLS
ncbi:carbohydrate kinase family protein [Candidatus Campbellbacteria bacterium]|nr:MAG: carbohydrate kinase family protein [Candidatus Campbellbacteria bacterium]